MTDKEKRQKLAELAKKRDQLDREIASLRRLNSENADGPARGNWKARIVTK